ncbi:MAG TPA: ATP-dependent sacrificial sulfur transferase LarE [Deltaproteobacteria bacterium]|nr:ATP-dependent sacrificial sulfur transferase LarE [Deltaproteobacteria bacterium]
MSEMNEEKIATLKQIIRQYESVAVAFSGGVDSSLLLALSVEVLGRDQVVALIGSSPTYPARERERAITFCEHVGVEYHILETNEIGDARYRENDPLRCYYCKCHLFDDALRFARERGVAVVVEGSNADDSSDYRPGRRATSERDIKSPLLEAGFTKKEIREISKELGLATHDLPAKACLASRIPYGTAIDERILQKIDRAEGFLESLGLGQVRVRYHGDIARIEVDPIEFGRLLEARESIVDRLKEIGFTYIALDLSGYRTGSMNEKLGLKPSPPPGNR